MRPIFALFLALAGCSADGGTYAQSNTAALANNVVSTSNELDDATIALFRHLKPSDKDECLSRANYIPIMQTRRRNSVLISCLSAADKRNRGV